MSDELNDFPNDLPSIEEPPAEVSAETEPSQTQEPQAEETTGAKTAEPEQQAAAEDSPPEPEKSDKQTDNVPITALLDEREKRQQFERQVKDYEAQLEKLKQQPVQAPDLLDDQQGYANHIQQQVDQKIRTATFEMSQQLMRAQHDDYDQAADAFLEMTKSNPQLVADMQAHPIPAKFVYETAKKAEQYAAMQDVDTYKAKLKAEARTEVKAEMEAEAEAKAEKEAKLNGALAPSLTNTRAAGANNTQLAVPDPHGKGGMFDR
jgi:hypothetical protein